MDLYAMFLLWLTEPSVSWLAEPTAAAITSSHKKERRGERWRKQAAGAHGRQRHSPSPLDWYRRVRLLSCWRLMLALHSLVWRVLLWTLVPDAGESPLRFPSVFNRMFFFSIQKDVARYWLLLMCSTVVGQIATSHRSIAVRFSHNARFFYDIPAVKILENSLHFTDR